MRGLLVALLLFLPQVAAAQPGNRPHDPAFWQDVIDAPGCPAETFVATLQDRRGRVQCDYENRQSQRACISQSVTWLMRRCGAGQDYLAQRRCYEKTTGDDTDPSAVLDCLADRRGEPTPKPRSRFLLQSETPSVSTVRTVPRDGPAFLRWTLRQVWSPLPPGALGEDDYGDLWVPEIAEDMKRRVDALILEWVWATIAALPSEAEIAGMDWLPLPVRVEARNSLLDIQDLLYDGKLVTCAKIDGVREPRNLDIRPFRWTLRCAGEVRLQSRWAAEDVFRHAAILFDMVDSV